MKLPHNEIYQIGLREVFNYFWSRHYSFHDIDMDVSDQSSIAVYGIVCLVFLIIICPIFLLCYFHTHVQAESSTPAVSDLKLVFDNTE